jgi:DNA-binding transcriptional ArsR family regulator
MATPPRDRTSVLLTGDCRALRRRLDAIAWMVLEEIALDATDDGDRVVAATSARRIADQLRIDPGTAARALRALREAGLVTFDRRAATQGRFGLSSYELTDVQGLVLRPCVLRPHVVDPRTATPDMDERLLRSTRVLEGDSVAPPPARNERRTRTRADATASPLTDSNDASEAAAEIGIVPPARRSQRRRRPPRDGMHPELGLDLGADS